MDSACRSISSDIWYATWFLMVREIWPCEHGEPSKNHLEVPRRSTKKSVILEAPRKSSRRFLVKVVATRI
jgi:hypothetical protein